MAINAVNEDPNSAIGLHAIRLDVQDQEAHHIGLLREGLRASCESLESFQSWIGHELNRVGMQVTRYAVDDAELLAQPAQHKTLRENPTALNRGVNVVGRLAGQEDVPGILLFGHADKAPVAYELGRKNPSLVQKDRRLEGPGIADDVAGITGMLSAVETFLRLGLRPRGVLLLASVLGKQMGVFGTYGLTRRFGPAHAAIYGHPAESGNGLCELKIASLGIAEFILTVDGKRPDTTEPHHAIYSRSGVSAIEKSTYLVQGIARWAAELNRLPAYSHAELEKRAGQSFAVSFGRIMSGADGAVYEMPMRCVIQGVVSFSPSIRLAHVQDSFASILGQLAQADVWLSQDHVHLEWGDIIAESCQSDADSEFIRTAREVITEVIGKPPVLNYGHSASDLRYPLLWWGAQAIGLGPTAGEAGTEHEYVDRAEYLDTIVATVELLRHTA